MTVEIFWASGSPYAWRVLLALELKQVPYTSHVLSFSAGDHKKPAYLTLNPRGKVPTLRDGDVVVTESLGMMVYVDRKFPEPALFGSTPAEAGAIFSAISEYTSYVDAHVEAFILPLYFGRADAEAASLRRSADVLRTELSRLEHKLMHTTYVAGDVLSAADLVWYPHVKSIERAAAKPAAAAFDFGLLPLAETHSAIARWAQRVETIPGYERTYPPHWRA